MNLDNDHDRNQKFARDVVTELKRHAYEALWAGGCVRDRLLGKLPKDYDVATSATPDQVQEVFGRRRTLLIGASFGVVSVLGRKGTAPVEVATFREDGGYTDGRHPDSVRYSNAEQDAQRRDFTINGIFFDPDLNQVIDYVHGREDLDERIIRCIGDPHARFEEDKLRMLRAVRFAATLDFEIADNTKAAVVARAQEMSCVSAERIAAEMKRMLTHRNCRRGLELLQETGLRSIVLPEYGSLDLQLRDEWQECLRLQGSRAQAWCFPTALAALALPLEQHLPVKKILHELAKRWKLSNDDRDLSIWIARHVELVRNARQVDWPDLQAVLIHPEVERLLAFCESSYRETDRDLVSHLAYCRAKLMLPTEKLNPNPLVDGNDLMSAGIPAGRQLGAALREIRRMQLDGKLTTAQDAIDWAQDVIQKGDAKP